MRCGRARHARDPLWRTPCNIQRVLDTFRIPIGWGELARRTVKEFIADDGLGMAAQLAYYFLLALFPAILFLIALASFFSLTAALEHVDSLGQFVPPDVLGILKDQIASLSNAEDSGILTFGVLGALWSSSSALTSATSSLNRAYDIEDSRPWWKVRLLAIMLTIALAIFVIVSFTLVVAGPALAEGLANRFGLGWAFEWTWKILQWPVAFMLVVFALGLVFYFAPDAEQDWEWITPGAVLATALWVVASLGFRMYVTRFADYNATYGTIGGFVVLLVWFYVSSIAILIGAEMNAEIEHASPYGKDPGERWAGEKKKLGRAAARAYEAHLRAMRPAAQSLKEATARLVTGREDPF